MPVLQLEYKGAPVSCGISKVDRAKLYGYTKTEILDERGRLCQMATLASDGRTLIPAGGVALAYVSPSGAWRDKKELQAVDMSGEPIAGVTSTFKEVVHLDQECTEEDLLDHNIRMVYQLSPDDEMEFPESLIAALQSGKIFTFPFSYRGGLTADTAFILEGSDQTIWMLIGKKTDVNYISYDQAKGVAEADEPEEDDEDLDFNMF
ncbi:MAG: hypothetical protein P1U89_24230 [Verrucomicrobiales bacterium]|nr:hypothetical protein [Verrucomicrobiales bacterium]